MGLADTEITFWALVLGDSLGLGVLQGVEWDKVATWMGSPGRARLGRVGSRPEGC